MNLLRLHVSTIATDSGFSPVVLMMPGMLFTGNRDSQYPHEHVGVSWIQLTPKRVHLLRL